jgi:tryptophanyl-tRNA synthetase
MRPTGRLHIGHYFGALENWVRLQNETLPSGGGREGQAPPLQASGHVAEKSGHGSAVPLRGGEKAYECFYFIADWHALTSDYADTSGVAQNTIEIMTDYLASGLDPAKSVIFQQSLVPEHAELHLLLSMVTPLSWLERVPTYKEALEQVKDKDLHNYGFLGYPCLQTADIVIYSSPADAGKEGAQLYVPVGEDQVSHVELSREIVRKFNFHTGGIRLDQRGLSAPGNEELLERVMSRLLRPEELDRFFTPSQRFNLLEPAAQMRAREVGPANFIREMGPAARFFLLNEVLVEPDHILTKTPRIPGLDGRKMSKSYGNAITLSETDEEIRKKTKVMVTDPARKRRTDPGNPDVCPVYDWHKLFSAGEPGRLEWVRQGCTTAGIGCIECKAAMAENLIKWIGPKREARNKWEKDPKGVLEIIDDGSKRARVEAKKTMERVREAVFGWEKKRTELGNGSGPGAFDRSTD